MKVINKSHSLVEKIVWVLCHYLIFAAAVSISYGIKYNGTLIAASVFMWMDFVIYLFELSILLGMIRLDTYKIDS